MNSKSKIPRVALDNDEAGRMVAAAVNDDVWMEILVRFQAKYVIRLKLVCKRWLSLISSDQFRRLHTLRYYKPQPSLLLRTRTTRFFYFNPIISGDEKVTMVPYTFALPNPKIWSSCNGLMLLESDTTRTDYYVYNPTTKQSRKIILDYDHDYPSIMGLNLAFDPSKSPRYKIVCVRANRKEFSKLHVARSYRIEVYDSVSHTWNLRLEPFIDSSHIYINFSNGVHCNNSIYWKMSDALLYFDMDENIIGSLPGFWFHNFQLQEANGRLYLFPEKAGQSVALWELQGDDNYSQSWFLKYHDEQSQWWFLIPPNFWPNSLLRFIGGSNGDEASTLVAHVPGKIRAYNCLDKSFQELVDLTNQPFYHDNSMQFDYENVFQFGESLAPV